ncbi:CHAT domain-containing protein [Spirosoma fluviale]|uniref:CHAT domain-containing protein n=1 Tax=Spirosoma fluviale TaxID=1597977 RepID=A0A286GSM1_9BACT|nr:CHAT domain-containing protein [Spirosoma fluviale]SOD98533.1 CHAT domain-containing protein [Spirosoma fluviale]
MDTLLLCYANDRNRPLETLGNEDSDVDRLLDPRSSKNHFQKIRDSFATTESVAGKILTYQASLCLFHFSGHAGSTALQLEDATARGVGVAQLLARCPNLRLIFLNGCSTLNHVRLLADQHVKAAVIATRSPVDDYSATQFASAFYQALANQYSLQEAVEQARLRVQIKIRTDVRRIARGDLDTAPEVSPDQWYFFCPDEETANWELPTGEVTDEAPYIPNTTLRRTLFDALRLHDPTLTEQYRMKQKQTLSDEGLRSWLHEEVLQRLPFPISEPLRKLLCPHISPENKLIPVRATRDRLINYTTLLDSTVDLLMSTLLSQIRDWLQSADPVIARVDAATHQLVEELITNGWSNWQTDRIVTSVRPLRAFLEQQHTPHFIDELTTWLDQFQQETQLEGSLQFLYTLKERLTQPNGIGNVAALCQVGEEHLSELIKHMGFWARYRLESFKNIRAIRFYRQQPAYRHEMVVLRTSQSYRTDEMYFQEIQFADLWDCQSVLLVKITRQLREGTVTEELQAKGFLNLSPFLIDKNVFFKSDNAVFDLYSFHSGESDRLRFKHVARPEDTGLFVGPVDEELWAKQDFGVLREQFQSLRTLLGLPQVLPTTATTNTNDLDPSELSRI